MVIETKKLEGSDFKSKYRFVRKDKLAGDKTKPIDLMKKMLTFEDVSKGEEGEERENF